jgi:cell division protein FtsI (penicillin-binding protein 3)
VVSVPGYRIAAKTGTGEVAENGRYGSERIVSYAGVFPADRPAYAIVVTFGKPDTMKSSAAAAPVFNAIMEQVIKTFRVTPSTEAAPNLPLTW